VALVVFDLDGTLIDSRSDLASSTNEMLESFGAASRPVDKVAAMVGEGARVLVERALAAAALDVDLEEAFTRFRAIYDRRLFETTRVYDGIHHVVARAASRVPLAVLTNKPLAPSHRLLDALDLATHVRWVVGGDGPHGRKPDPAGLLALMQYAGATPDQTLLVGDSHIDAQTAVRAGARLCIAGYGFGWQREAVELRASDVVAATPADVGAAIDAFLG
jgi:phosphoglycolate phosphatase